MACRIRTRCEWSTRLQLEARCHARSCVVTLTYADEFLPPGGVLVKRDVQLFMKRVRRSIGSCRFHAVGEYGDQFGRPHYHVTLFGIWMDRQQCEDIWGKGRCSVDLVSPESCNYVAGYVVKKWTNPKESQLHGRPPEFTLMSLKPGIGALAVPALGGPLKDAAAKTWLLGRGDVPSLYRIGQVQRRIGSYLKEKLREEVDFPRSEFAEAMVRYEMSTLREDKRARLRAQGFSGFEALWMEKAAPGCVDYAKAESLAARAKALKGTL